MDKSRSIARSRLTIGEDKASGDVSPTIALPADKMELQVSIVTSTSPTSDSPLSGKYRDLLRIASSPRKPQRYSVIALLCVAGLILLAMLESNLPLLWVTEIPRRATWMWNAQRYDGTPVAQLRVVEEEGKVGRLSTPPQTNKAAVESSSSFLNDNSSAGDPATNDTQAGNGDGGRREEAWRDAQGDGGAVDGDQTEHENSSSPVMAITAREEETPREEDEKGGRFSTSLEGASGGSNSEGDQSEGGRSFSSRTYGERGSSKDEQEGAEEVSGVGVRDEVGDGNEYSSSSSSSSASSPRLIGNVKAGQSVDYGDSDGDGDVDASAFITANVSSLSEAASGIHQKERRSSLPPPPPPPPPSTSPEDGDGGEAGSPVEERADERRQSPKRQTSSGAAAKNDSPVPVSSSENTTIAAASSAGRNSSSSDNTTTTIAAASSAGRNYSKSSSSFSSSSSDLSASDGAATASGNGSVPSPPSGEDNNAIPGSNWKKKLTKYSELVEYAALVVNTTASSSSSSATQIKCPGALQQRGVGGVRGGRNLEERKEVSEAKKMDSSAAHGGNPCGSGGSSSLRSPPLRFELVNISVTDEENEWANTHLHPWVDASGKVAQERLAVCVSCSFKYLVVNSKGEEEKCDDLRPSKSWCHLSCPLYSKCIKQFEEEQESTRRNNGTSTSWFEGKRNEPFLAIFRGAYVTLNGEVYNDEVLYDSRARCPRMRLPKTRLDRALKFRFKKVFVADYSFLGPYHELADMASRLMGYYDQLIADPSIMIHTTAGFGQDDFSIKVFDNHTVATTLAQIMSDVFKIDPSRLVTGDVYADEVIISQVPCWNNEWLAQVYMSRLSKFMRRWVVEQSGGALSPDLPVGKGTVLVVKRTNRRWITNHDELVAGLKRLLSKSNKTLEVYDDRKVHGVKAIWPLFYRADMVIASHGAALINTMAGRRGMIVYEFIQPHRPFVDPANVNVCFRDMSILLGHEYFSDMPKEFHKIVPYFDPKSREWIEPPTSMTVDVDLTVTRVEKVLRDRNWL